MPIGNSQNIDIFVATDILAVTPSNTVDLPSPGRLIRAATDGTIRVTTYNGNVRDTRIVKDQPIPLYVTRIHATGTTATGIEVFV